MAEFEKGVMVRFLNSIKKFSENGCVGFDDETRGENFKRYVLVPNSDIDEKCLFAVARIARDRGYTEGITYATNGVAYLFRETKSTKLTLSGVSFLERQ